MRYVECPEKDLPTHTVPTPEVLAGHLANRCPQCHEEGDCRLCAQAKYLAAL